MKIDDLDEINIEEELSKLTVVDEKKNANEDNANDVDDIDIERELELLSTVKQSEKNKINYCRNCGSENNQSDIACTSCGFDFLHGYKYCQQCGEDTKEGQRLCLKCGSELLSENHNNQQRKMHLNYEQDNGFAILGFFIPIVGFILYLVMKETEPGKSTSAGKGALIGFIVGTIFSVIWIAASMSAVSIY